MKRKVRIYRFIRLVLVKFSVIGCIGAICLYPETKKWFLTQAGSDFLKLLGSATLGVVIALIVILLLTLLLGRVYCSVLCPLGILQDLMSIFRRKPYVYQPHKSKIRYAVLIFTVISALIGFMLPLTWLMPSANFVILINNVFLEIIQWADQLIHFLKEPVTVRPALTAMLTSWAFFIGLMILVRWRGRVYCNTLCPVGAVLGLISRKAFWRVSINQGKCVGCGVCERACKAGCIDSKNKRVHTEECVMCLNCMDVCKLDGIQLKHKPFSERNEISVKPGRREFLAAGAGIAAGAAVRLTGKQKNIPPMPPGAGNFDRFTAKCVGCGLCISSCRGKVLAPSITQYGIRGFMQPYLDMNKGACQFDCQSCMKVCPCGALSLLELADKQCRRIGLAHYAKERCVAYLEGMDCGACAEHCPVGALEMVPYKNTRIPRVNESLCIGCGACQHICPVRPVQAVVVQGVTDQTPVQKPKTQVQKKLQAEDDFPF